MQGTFGPLRLGSIFCFVCLNALDMLTTSAGLRVGLSEGNPMMAAVLSSVGPATMYTLKMLIAWAAIAVIVLMLAVVLIGAQGIAASSKNVEAGRSAGQASVHMPQPMQESAM